MNKLYCLGVTAIVLFILSISNVNAQVPNAGFENWTNGNPDGWTTDNIAGVVVNVTQSTDVHSGSSSAKMQVVNYYSQPFPAEMWTTSGISSSSLPGALTGFYKFSPGANSTELGVVFELYKGSSAVGAGGDTLKAASSYTQFSVPISYINSETPDSLFIDIVLVDSSISGQTGSTAYFDDLSLSNTTGIRENSNSPITFRLNQNYPNPFNPTTNISYNLPEQGFVKLNIYNINGQLVRTLVNENQNTGAHQVIWNGTNSYGKEVSSGVYIYRIIAGKNSSIKKMVLLK